MNSSAASSAVPASSRWFEQAAAAAVIGVASVAGAGEPRALDAQGWPFTAGTEAARRVELSQTLTSALDRQLRETQSRHLRSGVVRLVDHGQMVTLQADLLDVTTGRLDRLDSAWMKIDGQWVALFETVGGVDAINTASLDAAAPEASDPN